MDERRSKPRLSVSLDAVWNEDSGTRHSARVTDLSEGGCYLDTVGEVMTGEIVAFRVLMPDEDWLYLEGEVKHHRHGFGFGVQFIDLNDEQTQKLLSLLELAKNAGPDTFTISADLVEE
jgi:PilZ domain